MEVAPEAAEALSALGEQIVREWKEEKGEN
jgi:hypothetical protein